MPNTVEIWESGGPVAGPGALTAPKAMDGFDLIWMQTNLQEQMKKVEDNIRLIEKNANLSDTEKMFQMQMAMNTWSAMGNLRTNELKAVASVLDNIVRNTAA